MDLYELYHICIVAVTAMVLLAQTVSGLQCHVCNSYDNPKCSETMDTTEHQQDCVDNRYNVCMKLTTVSYEVTKSGDTEKQGTLITRYCGESKWHGCSTRDGAGSLITECACKGEACNGSKRHLANYSVIISSVVATFAVVVQRLT